MLLFQTSKCLINFFMEKLEIHLVRVLGFIINVRVVSLMNYLLLSYLRESPNSKKKTMISRMNATICPSKCKSISIWMINSLKLLRLLKTNYQLLIKTNNTKEKSIIRLKDNIDKKVLTLKTVWIKRVLITKDNYLLILNF